MKPERPVALLLVAILALLVGGQLVLCNVGYGVAVVGFLSTPFIAAEMKPGDLGNWWDVAQAVGDLLLGVLMMVGGVGLLGCREWARRLSLLWSVLLALSCLAALARWGHGWVTDEPIVPDDPNDAVDRAVASGLIGLGLIEPAWLLIYLVFATWAWFTLRRWDVIAACSAEYRASVKRLTREILGPSAEADDD